MVLISLLSHETTCIIIIFMGLEEVEFGVGSSDDIAEACRLESAADGRADHAAMSGDVDFCIFAHCHTLSPASLKRRSCSANAKSDSTISFTSSLKRTLGSQPSTRFALDASPSS